MAQFMKNYMEASIAVIIAMIAFWMVEARHYVDRNEMRNSIKDAIYLSEQNNPYLKDRQVLMNALEENKQLRRDSALLLEAINGLKVDVAVLSSKIDSLKENTNVQPNSTKIR